MENLGAITFRETALLVDEAAATHAELRARRRRGGPRERPHVVRRPGDDGWWNGLWLNEAFATFMEMLAVDAWKPEWQRWTTFGVSRVGGAAGGRPAQHAAHRVPRAGTARRRRHVRRADLRKGRVGAAHAGAVPRRRGLPRPACATTWTAPYANTETGDLWDGLGQAVGQPIPAVMDGWIFRPATRSSASASTAASSCCAQQRFTYLPEPLAGEAPPARRQPRGRCRCSSASRPAAERPSSAAAPDGARGAAAAAGRTASRSWSTRAATASTACATTPELLDAAARPAAAAWRPSSASTSSTTPGRVPGRAMPLTDYLDLTAQFRGERDKNVWSVLIGSFQLAEPARRRRRSAALEALVRDRVAPALAALGWEPQPGEDELDPSAPRRPDARARHAGQRRRGPGAGGRALRQPRARTGPRGRQRLAARRSPSWPTSATGPLRRFSSASGRRGRRRRSSATCYALAAFRQPALVERTLARTLNGEIRTQDAPFVVRACCSASAAARAAWDFVQGAVGRDGPALPGTDCGGCAEGVTGLATPSGRRTSTRFFQRRARSTSAARRWSSTSSSCASR